MDLRERVCGRQSDDDHLSAIPDTKSDGISSTASQFGPVLGSPRNAEQEPGGFYMRYLIPTAAIAVLIAAGCSAPADSGLRFSVSFPQSKSSTPLDGRLVLLLSKDTSQEPRKHVSENEMLASPLPVRHQCRRTWRRARPPSSTTMPSAGRRASLADVPAGDYYVQAVLNRYETYHLADGRTLKLPPDRGEGQQWATKPGNLYSSPTKLHVDPAHPQSFSLSLDQEVPPVKTKADTEFVKHIRIRSELLSKFWGRDVYLGAHVLVPKGFDSHPNARYPLMVFHGHFPEDISEFRIEPPDPNLKPVYSNRFHLEGYNRIEQQEAYASYQKWIVGRFPALPGRRDPARQSVLRRQLRGQFREPWSVRRRHQQGADSRDREALSRHRRGLGAIHVRRVDRRLGGAGDPGVLPGHVQRCIRGLSRSDRFPGLHARQPLQGRERLQADWAKPHRSSARRSATTWAKCLRPSATPTTWNWRSATTRARDSSTTSGRRYSARSGATVIRSRSSTRRAVRSITVLPSTGVTITT